MSPGRRGRPRVEVDVERAYDLLDGSRSQAAVAREVGVSVRTLWRRLSEHARGQAQGGPAKIAGASR
jgi:DNA invertase Pin-like site-specific DNA recombinase